MRFRLDTRVQPRMVTYMSLALLLAACGPMEEDHLAVGLIGDRPAALRDGRFGFLVHKPSEVGLTSKVGASWIRLQQGPFIWNEIEPRPGKWDFSRADQYVKLAQSSNLWTLGTIYPYADWDQQSCHTREKCYSDRKDFGLEALPGWRCSPCDSSKYENFVARLTERYDGDGVDDMPGLTVPVTSWEILNEPDLQGFAFYTGDALGYLEIARSSHKAIKAACPTCKVVQAGAADGQGSPDFWFTFYQRGGGAYVDVANVHYVEEGNASDLNVGRFKEILEHMGVQKPIWVTEAQFKPGTTNVEAPVKGALAAGAEKVFFTGFEIGFIGSRDDQSYSKELFDLIAKYR